MENPEKNASSRKLRVIFPKKGRLQEDAARLLEASGFRLARNSERHDYGIVSDMSGEIDDFEILLQRAGDALENLDSGLADLALIGLDTYLEAESRARLEQRLLNARITATFNLSACALWIAGAPGQGISSAADLSGKRIATSYPALLRRWLEENGVQNAAIIARSGGIEDYVRLGLADVICDVVESGRTLQANGLEKIIKLHDSSAALAARSGNWPYEYEKTALLLSQRLLRSQTPACAPAL